MEIKQALSYIQAQAYTPDQLLNYVYSVSNLQSELIGAYLLHKKQSSCVLVGYNLENPSDISELDNAIKEVLRADTMQEITVLAPIRPQSAPNYAQSLEQDFYYFLDLPVKPKAKIKNMLNRAKKEAFVTQTSGQSAWSGEHHALMLSSLKNKQLDQAQVIIMQGIEKYILSSSDCVLFSAYSNKTNSLLACALADFSSFSTAFYMYAFRKEEDENVPGVADLVLYELLKEAQQRGYNKCNLGLGINDGIRFFKEKWGAKASLAFIQTSWKTEDVIDNKSWFSKLFQRATK